MDTNTICYTSWCILMFSLLQYVHEITTLSYSFIYPFQLKATQAGFYDHMHLTSQCFCFTSICPINFDAVTDSFTTKFRCSMNLIRQLNSDSFHNFLKLKLMMTRMPTPRKLTTTYFQPFIANKKFRTDFEQVPNSPIFTPL